VVVVVLDHLFRWPAGGFIGVDVFFVISGFLISGSLVREVDRSGWVSLKGFYVRRARRILPAAITVLAVSVAAAYVLWPVLRADQTALAAAASLFFAANWHFAVLGTDYLQADGPVSPLQHFWSLGVEEQFYILWPWVIVLTFAAGVRSAYRRQQRRLLALVFCSVVIVSFAFSLFMTARHPALAYFDSLSRMWELAAGALLALAASRVGRWSYQVRTVLQWVGLVVLVAGVFLVSPHSAFPGPWAVLPVGGAILVIAGGCGWVPTNALLTNRVSRYVGDISYSLYLWHFPVIVFTSSVAGEGAAQRIFMVVVMCTLAILSYHHVENRFRTPRAPKTSVGTNHGRRSDVLVAATVSVLVLSMSALQLFGPQALTVAVPRPAPGVSEDGAAGGPRSHGAPGDGADAPHAPWNIDQLHAAVAQAEIDDSWPAEVEQRMRLMGPHEQPPQLFDPPSGCRNNVASSAPAASCLREGQAQGAPVAVVVGDSVAVSWVPAVEAALPEWTVHAMGFANCPAIPARVGTDGFDEECAQAQQAMRDFITSVDADLVITSAAQSSLARLTSGASGTEAAEEWESAIGDFVAATRSRNVVILGNPPAGVRPADCLAEEAGPQGCTADVGALWDSKAAAERRGTQRAAAQGADIVYIDPAPWMCTGQGRCPAYADGTPFRFDGAHLTHEASVRLGGVLAQALKDAGFDHVGTKKTPAGASPDVVPDPST